MNKEEALQNCTVDGLVVKLPKVVLDRNTYLEVAKALNLIGGTWKGGKTAGFVFNEDPTELLQQISGGEKINLKKEFQFFETPADIADMVVELAGEIKPSDEVLEPSAGQGAIVKAIKRACGNDKLVHVYELMPVNQTILKRIDNIDFLGDDFLKCDYKFDKILANPPFAKCYDIIHIKKMYDCLIDGGRLISIASTHWKYSMNKKETEFKNWLNSVGAQIYDIEKGSFKTSGTMVDTVIIVIDK